MEQLTVDKKTLDKNSMLVKNMESNMYFESAVESEAVSFNWLDTIEHICPYIDNIIRNPKFALVSEEDVVKIEKAKKVSVESIKDLAKKTHYIEKIDPITNEVHPSKILIMRREETYNTYENRFIYTLVSNLIRFIVRKEKMLENLKSKKDKTLEYAASTNTNNEKINIELEISAVKLSKDPEEFEKELESIKIRIKKINDYIISWRRNDFFTSLKKARVAFVIPPIKKTNMILKNPNFQMAIKLWEFLQNYDIKNSSKPKEGLNSTGNEVLKTIMDDTFLTSYYILDSINASKRWQEKKITQYAILMIRQQIKNTVAILMNSGIDITDKEILQLVSSEIKNEKNRKLVNSSDVKKKFRSIMDEYLEKTQDYL